MADEGGVHSEPLSNIIASSAAAGIIARLFCHPLDTAKARLQGSSSVTVFRNTAHVLRVTLAEEGLRGLYRGFAAVTVGGTPALCLYLSTYEFSKTTLKKFPAIEKSPFLFYFGCGMIAETVSCIIFVPVDVIKERLQVQRSLDLPNAKVNYKGSWDALRTIMRTEGMRGVYRGYGATLLSFGPFSAFYFAFYETFKGLASRGLKTPPDDLRFPWVLSCAACAGGLASYITNPLDLAKLRLQISRQYSQADSAVKPVETYNQFWETLRTVYKHEGAQGLFRGAGARVLFHAPMTAITMVAYEQCKKSFAPFFRF